MPAVTSRVFVRLCCSLLRAASSKHEHAPDQQRDGADRSFRIDFRRGCRLRGREPRRDGSQSVGNARKTESQNQCAQ